MADNYGLLVALSKLPTPPRTNQFSPYWVCFTTFIHLSLEAQPISVSLSAVMTTTGCVTTPPPTLHSLIPVSCGCLSFNCELTTRFERAQRLAVAVRSGISAGAKSARLRLNPDQFGSITLGSLPLPLFSSHFLPRFLRYRSPWWKSKQNTILWT